jgi:hypothetical protein
MATPTHRENTHREMRLGIVHSTDEQTCTLLVDGQQLTVPYARPFPGPRVERVAPGHLIATARADDGSEVAVWRWFDAFVQESAGTTVRLWEPAHGSVTAMARRPDHRLRPGGRAYLSAGLPGAPWWVAGPVVDRAENAEVELEEVEKFFTTVGLWDEIG